MELVSRLPLSQTVVVIRDGTQKLCQPWWHVPWIWHCSYSIKKQETWDHKFYNISPMYCIFGWVLVTSLRTRSCTSRTRMASNKEGAPTAVTVPVSAKSSSTSCKVQTDAFWDVEATFQHRVPGHETLTWEGDSIIVIPHFRSIYFLFIVDPLGSSLIHIIANVPCMDFFFGRILA